VSDEAKLINQKKKRSCAAKAKPHVLKYSREMQSVDSSSMSFSHLFIYMASSATDYCRK